MKKKIALFISAVCLLLSGCGVSQDDYNGLQEKYNTLQSEYDDLQSRYDDIKENYDKMVDEKAQKAEAGMALSYPKAWVTNYFGDDCLIMFSDNNEYLQIVSQKEYNATSDSVKDIYESVLVSMQGLGTYINEINQDRIAIKFEQGEGKEFLEFVFKRENGGYTLESINGDLQNASVLIQGLSSVSSMDKQANSNQENNLEKEEVAHRDGMYGISDKDISDIGGSSVFTRDDVNNDVTGNWRVSAINKSFEPVYYALSYYEKYFRNDKEIHAIVNFCDNTTTCIQTFGGNELYVTTYDYVKGEEHNADLMFSGTELAAYIIYIDNGDIEYISE